MSLESAKMRLEQAVARRDHVQRELEDTDRQLQAVNQKQARQGITKYKSFCRSCKTFQ